MFRTHTLVVGSRKEIVTKLRLNGANIVQGDISSSRNEEEQDLWELINVYYKEQLGLTYERDWAEIERKYNMYRMKALLPPSSRFTRPIGVIEARLPLNNLLDKIEDTCLDTKGIFLMAIPQPVREGARNISKMFKAKLGSTYDLHIILAPIDVISRNWTDIYSDDVQILWDCGSSHTEVGKLNVIEHLLLKDSLGRGITTNFLAAAILIFKIFYDNQNPTSMLPVEPYQDRREIDQIVDVWSNDKKVIVSIDDVDMEEAFKRRVAFVPPPKSTSVSRIKINDKAIVSIGRFSYRSHVYDPTIHEVWRTQGFCSEDLRRVNLDILDSNILIHLLYFFEPPWEGRDPFPPSWALNTYLPWQSTSWLIKTWCKRGVDSLVQLINTVQSSENITSETLSLLKKANQPNEARHRITFLKQILATYGININDKDLWGLKNEDVLIFLQRYLLWDRPRNTTKRQLAGDYIFVEGNLMTLKDYLLNIFHLDDNQLNNWIDLIIQASNKGWSELIKSNDYSLMFYELINKIAPNLLSLNQELCKQIYIILDSCYVDLYKRTYI